MTPSAVLVKCPYHVPEHVHYWVHVSIVEDAGTPDYESNNLNNEAPPEKRVRTSDYTSIRNTSNTNNNTKREIDQEVENPQQPSRRSVILDEDFGLIFKLPIQRDVIEIPSSLSRDTTTEHDHQSGNSQESINILEGFLGDIHDPIDLHFDYTNNNTETDNGGEPPKRRRSVRIIFRFYFRSLLQKRNQNNLLIYEIDEDLHSFIAQSHCAQQQRHLHHYKKTVPRMSSRHRRIYALVQRSQSYCKYRNEFDDIEIEFRLSNSTGSSTMMHDLGVRVIFNAKKSFFPLNGSCCNTLVPANGPSLLPELATTTTLTTPNMKLNPLRLPIALRIFGMVTIKQGSILYARTDELDSPLKDLEGSEGVIVQFFTCPLAYAAQHLRDTEPSTSLSAAVPCYRVLKDIERVVHCENEEQYEYFIRSTALCKKFRLGCAVLRGRQFYIRWGEAINYIAPLTDADNSSRDTQDTHIDASMSGSIKQEQQEQEQQQQQQTIVLDSHVCETIARIVNNGLSNFEMMTYIERVILKKQQEQQQHQHHTDRDHTATFSYFQCPTRRVPSVLQSLIDPTDKDHQKYNSKFANQVVLFTILEGEGAQLGDKLAIGHHTLLLVDMRPPNKKFVYYFDPFSQSISSPTRETTPRQLLRVLLHGGSHFNNVADDDDDAGNNDTRPFLFQENYGDVMQPDNCSCGLYCLWFLHYSQYWLSRRDNIGKPIPKITSTAQSLHNYIVNQFLEQVLLVVCCI